MGNSWVRRWRLDASGGDSALTQDPGVVGDDLALGVEDGFVALDGDFAGDGFDDAQDGGADLLVGGGGAHVFGADLVDEAAAGAFAAGLADEDFAGVEGDGLYRAVFEVEDVWRRKHEDEDEGEVQDGGAEDGAGDQDEIVVV